MDSLTVWLNLGLILLFVAGNAFFVGSEIAISSARRSRIKQMADMGNKAAKTVEMLHNEPERFYSVTQVGITLVSLGLGAFGMETISTLTDPSFVALFALFGDSQAIQTAAHTTSYAFAFVVISFLHVVAGELAPKVLAFHKAEAISMAVGWLVNWMYIIFKPLIYFMKLASNGLLWIFGQRDLAHGGDSHFTMSVEEIRMVLTASEKDGVLAPEETQMIQGVFNLDEHNVYEAMVPRTEILALSKDASLSDALRLFLCEPVRTEGLDLLPLSGASRSLLRRARYDGYALMEGLVLAANEPMLALARRLGFSVEAVPPDGTVLRVLRRLQPAPPPAADSP